MNIVLADFVKCYLATAAWSSNDTKDGEDFETLQEFDWSEQAVQEAEDDCIKFIRKVEEVFGTEKAEAILTREGNDLTYLAPHDFWLTRVGHGAGFWDGDWGEYDEGGKHLTAISESMGEHIYVYKGEDALLYFG